MVKIRFEQPTDVTEIRSLITGAFSPALYYEGAEAAIVDFLREAGEMTLSLVAEVAGEILGHAAFSPVSINGSSTAWVGLGPISVHLNHRNRGIGAALIREGVQQAKNLKAHGCVTVGNLHYYKDFGFKNHVGMHLTGAPTKDFLTMPFGDDIPSGEVLFHNAFYFAYK